MKLRRNLTRTAILFGSIGLAIACLANYFRLRAVRADLFVVLHSNVKNLVEFNPKKLFQNKHGIRLTCDLFDANGSQISVDARWRKETDKFDPHHDRAAWFPNEFSNKFTLGNTMATDIDSVEIIGTRCEVGFSCILRGEKKNLASSTEFVESNAPRVFALIQYQALKEQDCLGEYRRFMPNGEGVEIKFDANQSTFSVIKGQKVLKGCLGSKDYFVNGKHASFMRPVLLNESGEIEASQDFRDVIEAL